MTFIERKVGNKVVYGWGTIFRIHGGGEWDVWKIGPFVTEGKCFSPLKT